MNYKKTLRALIVLFFAAFFLSISLPASATEISPETASSTASILIRSGDTLIGPFLVDIPAAATPRVSLTPTSGGSPTEIPADSALAELSLLDSTSDEFNISDLQYFSSFNSFLINCITIPAVSTTPFCGNWQFVINGMAPFVGADHVELSNGDRVIFYFGSPRTVSISTTTAAVGETFTGKAESYDPETNTYLPAQGFTLGLTQPNPNDPFNPIVVSSSAVDSLGEANFALSATGTYALGIAEDFFFPSVSINIVDLPAPTTTATSTEATSTEEDSPPPELSGGGGGGPHHDIVSIENALRYLANNQNPDGSFGGDLYTDWAAIALGSAAHGTSFDKIYNFLKNAPATGTLTTDYERRAMALISLGINPKSGTPTNYIKKITDGFDGTQIGDAALVNEDIFAIFPLIKSGYSENDEIIKKVFAFIISKQKPDGSFEESPDLTAAAVQALSLAPSVDGASDAKIRARGFLAGAEGNDGGFGGSFTTSWVLQAITALGELPTAWEKSGKNPNDYLFTFQQQDGGLEPTTADKNMRVWATSYAILGAAGKTWESVMSSFPKETPPPPPEVGGGGGGSLIPPLQTVASSTATSTASSTEISTTTTAMTLDTATSTATTTDEITTPPPKKELKIKLRTVPKIEKAAAATTTSKNQNLEANVSSAHTNFEVLIGSFFGRVWRGANIVWRLILGN